MGIIPIPIIPIILRRLIMLIPSIPIMLNEHDCSSSSSQSSSGEWTSRIVHLLNDQHMGVVTAAASLIDALVKKNPDEYKVD